MNKMGILIIVTIITILILSNNHTHGNTLLPVKQSRIKVKNIDLMKITGGAGKGRIQDKEYNPNTKEKDKLIALGPKSIPYLITKLDDRRKYHHKPFCCWQKVYVGDVALVILLNFFTTKDWRNYTIPEIRWPILDEDKHKWLPTELDFIHFIFIYLILLRLHQQLANSLRSTASIR